MIVVPKSGLPVTIQIGSIPVGTSHVELPVISTPAGRDADGAWQVNIAIDHPELRRRVAAVLRAAADELDKGAADG